jgi:hypothetical protein
MAMHVPPHRHPDLSRLALLALPLVVVVLAGLLPATASATSLATESATTLHLTAPARGYVDTERTATAMLTRDDTAAPVDAATVRFERRVNGEWRAMDPATTDPTGTGTVTFTVRPDADDNAVRAVFDGTAVLDPSQSELVTVEPRRRSTRIVIKAPKKVVDETAVRLRLRWRTAQGVAVPGEGVVRQKVAGGKWKRYEEVSFNERGRVNLRVGPRVDSRWKVVGAEGRWWQAATSKVHRLDNVPPLAPVAYPANAPQPRVKVPRQPRAAGNGPNPQISRIPDAMWSSMVGRTWHQGCPVGRAQLRVVRVDYWGYSGYRYRGEIVVRDSIAGKTVGLFGDLYRARMPIRSMYRVDRFGWSGTLGGGNNYESMAAGNTSGFNCRGVVGNPSATSPHSYGRSIDINPWENPYKSRTGTVPNTWWVSRSHPRIAWRSSSHRMVQIMGANGFRWTYGTGDAHHFDG